MDYWYYFVAWLKYRRDRLTGRRPVEQLPDSETTRAIDAFLDDPSTGTRRTRPGHRAVRVRRQQSRAGQTGQSGHKAGASTAPAITTGYQGSYRLWPSSDRVADGTIPPVREAASADGESECLCPYCLGGSCLICRYCTMATCPNIRAWSKPPQPVTAFPARETAACAHCLFDIIEAEAGIWRLAWGGSHFNPYHCEGSPDGHAPRCPQCGSALGTSGGWTSCTADPSHCCHSDDGTVEGCGGCFYEPPQAPPGPGERELYAREQHDLDNPARRPS